MIRDNRIRYYVPADYSEGSNMDLLLKAIIDKTAAYEVLEKKHIADLIETRDAQRAETAQSTLERAKKLEAQAITPFSELSASWAEVVQAMQEAYSENIRKAITSAFYPENNEGKE